MTENDPNGLYKLYCDAMTEITLRQKVMTDILKREIRMGIRPSYEMCHLEMRMICELIAISCLAAHGDIPATRSGRLASAYEADWILRALEKLHPDFYPFPMKMTKRGTETVLSDNKDPYLTKDDVVSTYRKCGAVLHRGSIKKMGLLQTDDKEMRAIWPWLKKSQNLINQHTIILSRPGELVWVRVEDHRAHMRLLRNLEPKHTPPGPGGSERLDT